jgi:WD40-like Beta Propeller Repeat
MGPAGVRYRAIRSRICLLGCFAGLIAVLAADGAQATAPVGSNGKIAYGRSFNTSSEIFVINPDGSGTTNLSNTPTLNEREPSWSPNGMKIAFTRCASIFDCDVVVMSADGSGVTNLTNTPAPTGEARPAFSPDAQLIAYDRTDAGITDTSIWVMNQDGSNQHRLSNANVSAGESDFAPDFSPDGNTITYSHCTGAPNHQCDIWSMNSDGSGQHPLTDTSAPNSELGGSFSPTGASIVFQVDNGNTNTDDLAVMNADGSGRKPLTQTASAERRPVFSGDGLRLAFSFTDAVTDDLYTSDANAQGQTNLTQTPSDREDNPDWEDVQKCGAKRATIVGDDGPDRLLGTKGRNVFDANAATTGKNVVKGKGGNDLICIGAGKAKVNCGKGKRDKVIATGKGKRKVKGCEIKKGKLGKPKGK